MKVCFVGIGSIAKRHIKNLSEICAEKGISLQIDALRSIGSDKPENVANVYSEVAELPKDYDVIFLTNPTEYHAEMLLRLHDNAKHFFIEKPVASLATMDILKGFCPRPDSVYYVACPLRYNKVIHYLKDNIDLRTVRSVRCISSSYLPDWRPGTDYRETYSAHKALGGGVGIDLIHEWDYLTYLFGMPEEVKAFSGKVSNLEIDSDDYAVYIARYPAMTAELHLDYFGRKSMRRLDLFTDEETVYADMLLGVVGFMTHREHVVLKEDRDSYQKEEMLHFLDLVLSGKTSDNDIDHALKVLKLTQGEV